jgi:hypothetical protein
MTHSRLSLETRFCGLLCAILLSSAAARAQSCQTAGDLDDATRAAIANSAQHYFDLAGKGDSASLKQNSIPSLASDFSAVESAVKDDQSVLAGAQAAVKSLFLLTADGTAPIPHAEFYCGVFGKNGQTSESAEFFLDNLPPGKYAAVILDAASAQSRATFSVILQQAGADWKLGNLFVKNSQVAGHNSDWFVARARDYKTKGELHNAWLYYVLARSMVSPFPFMSTLATDRLYDEFQSLQPGDVPVAGKTADLAAGATTYKLIALFPDGVGDDLDLIVKYQMADVSDTTKAYQCNVAVMKALIEKYPEFRDAFAAVVARAVSPGGGDYGTLLAMKDIK